MKRKPSQKALRKKADAIFSKYIRQKYASKNGWVRCYTCGKALRIKKAQCGHCISRRKLSTRFDENNARPQCVACNIFRSGEQYIFGQKLKEEGVDIDALLLLSNKVEKIDYQEIIDKYARKLKDLS